MRLIYDDYQEVFVWVDDMDADIELSPQFDYEEDAVRWRDCIKKELLREKK